MITICTSTCQFYASMSSRSVSSIRSSSLGRSSSSIQGEPAGSFIELRTANPQQFQVNGEGWISYGITQMHLNTIHPSDAQATATWQAQLPFGTYEIFMYWPHDRNASERYLMDTVPMFLTLNSANYPITLNQRTNVPAFAKIIGGSGPETVAHNWYRIGNFSAIKQNGFETPQTMLLTLPTGRASDATKKASDGWVAAGDVRIYYKTPGITCGDGKCHETERDSCPIDCGGVNQCGNGYCDVNLGETLQLCVQDCGAPGVCGNLRCEPAVGENISNCRSDCQTMVGTTGGDGSGDVSGDDGGDTSGSGGETGGDGLDCGNGQCEEGETTNTCPGDCKRSSSSKSSVAAAQCGNGLCEYDKGETTTNCPKDCGGGAACGNGICDKDRKETEENCPEDCGSTIPTCGNYVCDKNQGETYVNCPKDCGSYCGDGICNTQSNENATNCAVDCGIKSSSSKASSKSSSSKPPPNICGDGICTADERDAFRFAMEGGLLCVVDCPGIITPGCSLTDKFGSTCNDSDCGMQPYTSGVTTYSNNTGAAPLRDFCIGTSAVAEAACVTDPYKNGALALSFFYTVDCPHGCLNGVCKQTPSGQSMDTRTERTIAPPVEIEEAPIEEYVPADAPEEPEVINIEVEFDEPFVPVGPSCGNTDDASFLCGMCLRSFCPFGNDRANTLCSFYCSASTSPASLSASVLDSISPIDIPGNNDKKPSLLVQVALFFLAWI